MGDEKKPQIGDIKTFLAKVPTETLESALKKFQGQRTISTVLAARRIAGAKRDVKIPRNLLKQLFRLTGGFKQEQITAPEESSRDLGYYLAGDNQGKYKALALKIGELETVFVEDNRGYLETNYGPKAWFFYRRKLVACTSGKNYCWLEDKQVNGAVHSLGVEFILPPK